MKKVFIYVLQVKINYRLEFFNPQGCQESSRLPAKIATYSVSIGWLLCVAFLYRWRFLNKIHLSLDWPLTLTTQPSISKLSNNPDPVDSLFPLFPTT